MVTGEGRTEFPEMGEFSPNYIGQRAAPGGPLPEINPGAVARSAVTPDPEAQFDVLNKAIPGLERKDDKYGNIMLRAPGMKDFTYLNKPGVSARDLDEFGTQTLATLPFLGIAGRGVSTLGRAGYGAGGLAASSVAQDAMATAAGSEQGLDPGRAGISAGFGAAVPVAGALARGAVGLASGIGSRAASAYRSVVNPRAEAVNEVQGAFLEDFRRGGLPNITQGERAQAGQRGQDLRTADFGGETVRANARKAANISPAARDMLMRVINPRFEGQTARGEALVANELGFTGSVQAVREQLGAQARQVRAPLYHQAYRLGASGIDSPVLQRLQQAPIVQRAMRRAAITLQDEAAITGRQSTGTHGPNGLTLEYWDHIKRALDGYTGVAFRQGDNTRGTQLRDMTRALRRELDAQVPIYRQARGTAQQFFNADDAAEAGINFAKGDYNVRDATQQINRFNQPERAMFAEGFMDEFVRKVRGVGDRASLLNRIMQSPQERDRVMLALGQQRYNQLEGFLRIEEIMDRLRTTMGNSTTARQLVELASRYGFQGLGAGIGGYGVATNDPKSMLIGSLMAGGRIAQQRINRQVAEYVAELLTSHDPDMFLMGIQQAARTPILDAIRAFDNALSEAGILTSTAIQGGVNASSDQSAPTRTPQDQPQTQTVPNPFVPGAP